MNYICRTQPRGFVLENVTGIRNKKHRKHFNKLLQQLEECRLPGSQKRAYAVSWRMVNTRSFGFPQNRKRIYIMGARRSTRKGVKTRKPNMVHLLPESKFACLDDFLEKGLPKVDIKKLCKTKRKGRSSRRRVFGIWTGTSSTQEPGKTSGRSPWAMFPQSHVHEPPATTSGSTTILAQTRSWRLCRVPQLPLAQKCVPFQERQNGGQRHVGSCPEGGNEGGAHGS